MIVLIGEYTRKPKRHEALADAVIRLNDRTTIKDLSAVLDEDVETLHGTLYYRVVATERIT